VPHSWVPPEAAERVRAIARADSHRRAGLYCESRDACEMYVRSGNFEWRMEDAAPVVTESEIEELVEELRGVVAAALGFQLEPKPTLAELNADLAQQRVFVLLSQPPPSREVLDAVQERLPDLVLVVRAAGSDGVIDGIEYVVPRLQTETEQRLLSAHRTMCRRLDVLTREESW
jgi:hypothetical protein